MASADDELSLYRSLRDPLATTEPFGVATMAHATGEGTRRGEFVIHLHDATRRHYDLRLQCGGTLLSFAVPRGPSLDPVERRLAVQTENHPLEYLDFEDVIPEGNYGAGPMIVWDIGTVSYLETTAEEGLARGKVDFVLAGHKMRGRFALVETTGRGPVTAKPRSWLLLKKADVHARQNDDTLERQPESVLSGLTVDQLGRRSQLYQELIERAGQLPGVVERVTSSVFAPMLCAKQGARLDDPERIYELKLDGVRIVATRDGAGVDLRYRSGRAASHSYPEVSRAVRALYPTECVLDGEVVSFDDRGRPRFQRLGPRIAARRPADIAAAARQAPATFLVFDLLALGPHDLRGVELWRRKALLAELLPRRGVVRYLDHIVGNGQALYAFCQREGLEGVVSKGRSSCYDARPRRSDAWCKHRIERREDFVVVGFVEGEGRARELGALELGSYMNGTLTYVGRVGTGFDAATRSALLTALQPLQCTGEVVAGELPQDGRIRHPVQPRMVATVKFLEWSPDRHLRMAVFVGIREDIAPQTCTAVPRLDEDEPELPLQVRAADGVEPLVREPEGDAAAGHGVQRVASATSAGKGRRVQVSNLDKVFWPEEGYTKGDLLDYYEAIAPTLLPLLVSRPVMLVRYPDGVRGKSFYQWNVPQGTPAWVRTLPLKREERDGKEVTTFLLDSVDALLHVVNLGCIPLHILASRREQLDQCDFITLDFDLGDRPLSDAVELASSLKEVLDDLGLHGFPKTSGQTGLHVLVAMGLGVPFEAAKVLVELLGRIVQARHPAISTMQRRISDRGDRVYIDVGQTGRSRTIVAPYSVRAYAGARVSTPLYWHEVHRALKPETFNIFTVAERVSGLGDPYRELLSLRPPMARVMEKLQRWVTPTKV